MDRNQYLVWTRASILEHFRTKIAESSGSAKPQVRIDIMDDFTVDDVTLQMNISFRDITRVEKMLMVELNLIIRTLENAGAYKMDEYKGFVLEAVTSGIPVYRNGPQGDQSYFDCLQKQDAPIKFIEFGQESAGSRVSIASCQVDYMLNFVT